MKCVQQYLYTVNNYRCVTVSGNLEMILAVVTFRRKTPIEGTGIYRVFTKEWCGFKN